MPIKDPKKKSESYRRWRDANRAKRNTTKREWARRNPEYRLIYRYGLTQALYNQMLEDQNHCCKICSRPAQLERHGKLVVDHLKGTRVVRGLLCNGCNRGLGFFRESSQALSAAIEYLRCQPL